MKNQWRIVISILLVIIVAVFALLNRGSVPVSFGFATVRWPLILLLLVSILIGAVLMILFSTISSVQKKRAYKDLEQSTTDQISKLQAENAQLNKRIQNSQSKQATGQQAKEIKALQTEITDLKAQLAAK
ncbi:lipopolysaccharide assembly protein LapA domain-containing protein [Levilactobacillus lindianensis]|uniref:lipopolysaccharide assembly protein LapA domain-containing protein n=1 Tax=Levilactobacillus lindianensis TaxID=2486018 RepID=UPI000F746D01|nr:lipopolysaccharide assembly protein LapA domain-containing protein [Levilactobacillus lindianensis]